MITRLTYDHGDYIHFRLKIFSVVIMFHEKYILWRKKVFQIPYLNTIKKVDARLQYFHKTNSIYSAIGFSISEIQKDH